MRPTVRHLGEMAPLDLPLFRSAPTIGESHLPLAPMRWDPAPIEGEAMTFLSGMRTISTGGDVLPTPASPSTSMPSPRA